MYKSKKILAIVPARGGSKGIRLKNLRKINNISLIGHVGKLIKKLRFIDLSIVSTDNDKIIKEALKYNLRIFFKRPKNLSGDKVSDYVVMRHALLQAEKKIKAVFDIVLLLQPTSPLRKPKDIINVLNIIIKNRYDSVWSISPINLKYHFTKQLIKKKNKLFFAHQKGPKIIARQQLKQTFFRNGVAYAFTRNCLLKKKKTLTNNTGFYFMKSKQISIDTLEDIKEVKKYLF